MPGNVLPDSRLKRGDMMSQVVDWELGDGRTVRCEVVPYFCANCGRHGGWCPRDNTTFLFWQCRKCHEKYGVIDGTYAVPEAEFCRAVEYEMERRFGRALTHVEIYALSELGKLGLSLERLASESPFPVPSR